VAMTALEDLEAGRTVKGDNGPLRPTRHCVERFASRFRPGVPLEEVEKELRRMFPAMSVTKKLPPAFRGHSQKEHTIGYAALGDCCFPLALFEGEWEMTTCLSTDLISEANLERKRDAQQNRRAASRTARKQKKLSHGRPVGRPVGRPRKRDWRSDASA